MGEDKIEQHVEIAGTAQTGDITLIGKIENVIKVIRQPALWQDAIWGFFTRNWIFVFSCLLVQSAILVLYQRYKNLFLLPVLVCLSLELVIVPIVWGSNLAFQKRISKTSLLVTVISIVGALGMVSWAAVPIIRPKTFPIEKFGIAIAMFGEGGNYRLSNEAMEISGQVYEGLCQELHQKLGSDEQSDPCGDINQSGSDILIQQIGVIPDTDTAEWYAHRINADIVIWGQILNTGEGKTTIRFQVAETLDKAVNPEFPVVMPVTNNYAEVIIRERDYETNPIKLKEAISQQTVYMSSFALGLYSYLQRDFPNAIKYFEIAGDITQPDKGDDWNTACVDHPDHADMRCESRALLYLYLGRSYNGMGLLKKGQPVLLAARELNPKEPAILISLAVGYGSLGQLDEQEEYLKEGFDAIDAWLSTHTDESSAALYDRGVIYQIWKQYNDAVIDFEAVIQDNPEYYVAYLNLAQSYAELGDYQNAVKTLKNAIMLSEMSRANPAWAHLNLAIIHEKFGHIDDARTEYQNAIQSEPDSSSMYIAYGLFLEKQGEITGALAAFNMTVETAWDKGWAYAALGDFQMRNGFFKDAANNLSKAVHYKPEDDLLHTKLAQAYMKLGENDKAEDEFEKAITLPGVSYYSYAEYAGFLYKQADYYCAVAMYQKALEIRPDEVAVLLNLGQTYQTLGETEKAREIYRYIIGKKELFSQSEMEEAEIRLNSLESSP